MARLTKPLTNTEIINAKPKGKDYTLSDGKGLYLLIKPNGAKLWRFEYKRPFTKKRALVSFGRYPDTALQQARERREDYLILLGQNIDPQQQQEQLKAEELQRLANTFRNVAESWKASKTGNIKPLTLAKYWRIVEMYLFPKLAEYPVTEITPLLAKSALVIPYQQGKAEIFRKSVKLLNAILNYAVYSLFLIPSNPCLMIATAFETLPRGHNPSINYDELPDFFERLEHSNISLMTKYLIQWQILTMVRSNESATAEWGDIDFDKRLWTIPPVKMKQTTANRNEPHFVPLSTQAIAILERARELKRNSPFIFASVRAKDGHLSNQTANKAIRDGLDYKGKQNAHGLRNIASTYLHEQGIMPDVVEMCLSHTIKGVRGIYNKAKYLEHRRHALQVWGDYIDQCKAQASTRQPT